MRRQRANESKELHYGKRHSLKKNNNNNNKRTGS